MKPLITTFISLTCCFQLFGQLTCTVETPEYLVQNVLAGYGIVTYDYSSSGSIGYFNSENTFLEDSLGVSSGVILSTGDLSNYAGPIGPNDMTDAGIDNGQPGEPTLSMSYMLGRPTFNAAVLRFKAYSLSDSIMIRYIFGSEAYPEDCSGQYSDGMAIFIDDGDEYCAYNFARVPDPNAPPFTTHVSTETINSNANSELFIDNEGSEQSSSAYYVQYDGITQVLEANVPVTPNAEYEITIVIADVDDEYWDSGLFLIANSMTADRTDMKAPEFSLSPNPAHETLNILEESGLSPESWRIVNQQGKDMLSGSFIDENGIDISTLNSGTYFFILNGASSSVRMFQKL